METQLLANATIVFPGERVSPGSLLLESGRIAVINPSQAQTRSIQVFDCGGRLLTPGLVDFHTHGIQRFFYGPSLTSEDFRVALQVLPQYGTTCIVPTIVPGEQPEALAPMAKLSHERCENGACVPGFHLEGPFVALGGAACPTLAGDVTLLRELIDATDGRVRVMSISPEQNNVLPVIEALVEKGILAFMTHTRATVEQTEAAIEAGARHATHFYDVFPVPPETEPGVRPVGAVEAILADPRVSVDFICDGVHVHPAAIRAAVAAKGWRNVMLISDSNIGAGLPAGQYDTPWGFPVTVKPGDAARHATKGYLAGSALTMDVGIANLLQWLRLPPEQVWAMATLNPARLLGLNNKGRIAPGADADLVLWDADLKVSKTWVGGRLCYDRGEKLS